MLSEAEIQEIDNKVEQERRTYAPEPEENMAGQTAFSSDRILEALKRNEDGDAELFVELNRGRLVYDAASGRWYVFQEHYWKIDALNEAMRAIDEVVEVYVLEAKRQGWQRLQAQKDGKNDETEKIKSIVEDLHKRIKDLLTVRRKKNVLELARTGADSLAIRGGEWDRDPWLLGCQNGVIDLKTGELRPGRPDDYIKTIAPVEYLGLDTPAPTWERFITEISGQNAGLPEYFQRLFGYGITGLTNWHVCPIFEGPDGRNGKGTLLETVKYTLGDLAYKTRAEILLESRSTPGRGSADADTLAFRGKRIIWASETNPGRTVNASRIKELVGGDTLNARAVYGRDPVEFHPSHLLILLTNSRPKAPADDAALWERIHLVPFHVRFVDAPQGPNERKADHDLSIKLQAEASGILSWMIRGCLEWQREGLNPPECLRAATAEYREDEDVLKHFIDERCLLRPDLVVRAKPFYENYQQWAGEMGHTPLSSVNFGKQMKKRFKYDEDRKGVFYQGVGLIRGDV